MNIVNRGLRENSIGDYADMMSTSNPGYWSHVIFSFLFYFTIVLIMLNVVNGIIVDTFQALRQEKDKYDYDRDNKCFVCEIERKDLEIKGKSFENHILIGHNAINYFRFMIDANMSDPFEQNFYQYFVYEKIKEKKSNFFPLKNVE